MIITTKNVDLFKPVLIEITSLSELCVLINILHVSRFHMDPFPRNQNEINLVETMLKQLTGLSK